MSQAARAHLAVEVAFENRHGLVMGVIATEANGTAGCVAARSILDRLQSRQHVLPGNRTEKLRATQCAGSHGTTESRECPVAIKLLPASE